ncbi:MAG: hypothetical protein ACK5IP_11285, partial [Paracoccus sp. (in: a-proteobacteria)]
PGKGQHGEAVEQQKGEAPGFRDCHLGISGRYLLTAKAGKRPPARGKAFPWRRQPIYVAQHFNQENVP